MAYGGIAAVLVEDVFEPSVQADNIGMDDALVGIKNEFFGKKFAFAVTIFRKIRQPHMFTHYLGYGRIAAGQTDSCTDLGMVTTLLQTLGFGNIMEQGSCNDESLGRQGLQVRVAVKAVPYTLGNPGNGEAVSPDIVEHAMFFHHMQAVRYGWGGQCHTTLLFAAEFMDKIHAIFGLFRRCILVDTVAKVKNMTKSPLGVIEQTFDAGP